MDNLSRLRILVCCTAFLIAFLFTASPAAAIDCPSCDDFNFCTIDSCDTTFGTCRHEPRSCDDGNPCTTDGCVNNFNNIGFCSHQIVPTGTSCDDQDSCTQGDACNSSGLCAGSQRPPASVCNDQNSCTVTDQCDDFGHCVGSALPGGASCDDGSLCTSGDTCAPDAGGAIVCQGTPQSCDDANPCTQDTCDPATGQCGHPAASCNDGNVCTTDSCDPAAGGCVRTPASGSCSTGRLCTVGDACSSGNCFPGAPRNCNDNLFCTVDSCSEALGGCRHVADNSLCPADSPCNHWVCNGCTASGCLGGCFNQLANVSMECDGNICSFDQCVRGICMGNSAPNNVACNDQDPCTSGDRCNLLHLWQCDGLPVSCDDGDVCTTDSCNSTDGQCTHQGSGGPGTCGVGACQRTVNCSTNPDGCVPGTPSPETCNAIDDDCDGLTDELGSATCGVGACARTVSNCVNGVPQSCVPGAPASEACNGLDDDCNGITDDMGTTTCGVGACERTVTACIGGNPQNCTPGFPSAETCNLIDDDCDGSTDEGQTTCGQGACQETVDNCVNGQPQTCVPGTPTPEQPCNGIDDDCDGIADPGGIQADCTINPSTFNLSAQGSTFNIECKVLDICDPANPIPVPGAQIETVYISRADRADSSNDDVVLPDPATLPCPSPLLGSLYERGIVEDGAARQNTPKGATFKFDLPSDGACETLDGDRQDLAGRLTAIPDNTSATICVSGKANGADFQGCTTALIRNKGLR
jgi:hypothetical protein